MSTNEAIGRYLRVLRKDQDLSLESFSAEVGIEKGRYRRIEVVEARIEVEELSAICKYYNYSSIDKFLADARAWETKRQGGQ